MITMSITALSNSTPVQAPQAPASTTSGADALANEQTFLKLFVAQLKNQDPSSPQDPTQFVAQLAQFSQLEQSLQMRQDLDSMKQIMTTPAPVAPPPVTPAP